MFFHFLFIYVCNAPALNGHKLRSCFIEERIASVFLGRFRCSLQLFSGMKCPLQRIKQIWKLSLGGATISAQMRDEIFKIWENDGCKVCAHHFDHLEARWKKTSTTAFYPIYVDVHPYKNISIPRYRVPQKTVKFVVIVPPFVLSEMLLSVQFSKMFWGLFIGDDM